MVGKPSNTRWGSRRMPEDAELSWRIKKPDRQKKSVPRKEGERRLCAGVPVRTKGIRCKWGVTACAEGGMTGKRQKGGGGGVHKKKKN